MSPDVDTQKPVSRQHEVENYGYYGYPFHWGGSGMLGNSTLPALMLAARAGDESAGLTRKQQSFVEAQAAFQRQRGDDPHLRSCRAISGYHLHASDDVVGHLEGFVVDDESWANRYLVVNTSDWWLGHYLLIAPPWIRFSRCILQYGQTPQVWPSHGIPTRSPIFNVSTPRPSASMRPTI